MIYYLPDILVSYLKVSKLIIKVVVINPWLLTQNEYRWGTAPTVFALCQQLNNIIHRKVPGTQAGKVFIIRGVHRTFYLFIVFGGGMLIFLGHIIIKALLRFTGSVFVTEKIKTKMFFLKISYKSSVNKLTI